MEQKWIEDLNSDDPRLRAEAVKQIALSGDPDYLRFLKEIVENDPNPQLREYAKKAARHLYTTTTPPAPRETPPPPPQTPKPGPDKKKVAEPAAAQAGDDNISRADRQAAADMVQRAFTLHTSERTARAIPIYAQALALNPGLEKEPYARSVAGELVGKSPDQALHILKDPNARQELIDEIRGKDKKGKKGKTPAAPKEPKEKPESTAEPTGLIQTWLSFFTMDESFFDRAADQANTEDTLLSVLVYTIASVVITMVTGFVQFQQITALMGEQLPQLGFNLGTIFFIILIGTVILSPISFYLTTGMQFLGARVFGGAGDFKTHAYLMALILVPATVLGGVVSLLAFIPIIGFLAGLAGFGISIFTLILTVRLVRSAHNLSTGKAIAGIIVPPIILSAIVGCILVAVGSSLVSMLTQLQ